MAEAREIYISPNGDHWYLLRDSENGHVFIRHTGNVASGGHVDDVSLSVFLGLGRDGPEHQALWTLLATLIKPSTSGLP